MTRENRWFIFALIALAAFLRLYRLGSQSIWIDEIFTISVSCPKPGLNIWDYLKYNIHGPFHSFVVYLFQMVSKNDAWLRLPSAIAGTAAVYVFYRWIDIWLGRNIARASAVLIAIHPLHIHYSQELRNYSFLFLCAVAACFFFHRLIENNRKRDYMYYVVLMALAALSNFTAAFLFITHTLIYFIRRGIKSSSVLRWLLVGTAILVLISPWVYRIYKVIDVPALFTPIKPGQLSSVERLRGETTVTFSALPYSSYVFSVGYTLGPSLRELHREHSLKLVLKDHAPAVFWVGLLFGSLCLYGVWVLARWKRNLLEAVIYLVIPIFVTYLLCWQNAKAYNVRYVFLSMPVFICFIATALQKLRRPPGPILWILVLLTVGLSLGNYYFNGRYAKEDVRSAANDLEDRIDPEDCILAPTVKEVFDYYYDGENPSFTVFAPKGTPKERVLDTLERLFAKCDSFWYVRAREWVDDPDGYVMEILTERCTILETIDFTGVRVIHYIQKNPPSR